MNDMRQAIENGFSPIEGWAGAAKRRQERADITEFQVNFGDGWEPVSYERMHYVLSGYYDNPAEVIQVMRDDPDKFQATTRSSIYRRNPDWID